MFLGFYSFDDFIFLYNRAIKKVFKIAIAGIFISFFVWTFALKKTVYQQIYAIPNTENLTIYNNDIFKPLPFQIKPAVVNSFDFSVQVDFVKSYQSVSKIVYIDRYNFLGTWYRSDEYAYMYDKIVPLDIATVSGKTAQPSILKDYEFEHEYRLLISKSKKYNPNSNNDINNNHIIPANKTVANGLAILNTGDIAYMEGYLVNITGLGTYKHFKLKSALTNGEISHQRAGGNTTGLCRIIYLTKIVFDGYEFK